MPITPAPEESKSAMPNAPLRIRSVRNLLEILEGMPGDSSLRMYRGQVRDWRLVPSIGRYPHVVQGYEDWRVFHDDLIERFLRLGRPFLTTDRSAVADAWVVAQHHGLPTRLLDTTTNPLKALFFAVNYPAEDSHDGVLWVVSYSGWFHDLDEASASFNELVPFLPAQLTPRLTAQEGAFISYPLPNNCKPLRPMERFKQKDVSLVKLVVPRKKKAALRIELDTLGIQFRLLFPDLEGVARSIKLTELGS